MRPRLKHDGPAGAGCGMCIQLAEEARMPWHGSSYINVLASAIGDGIREKHDAAVKRRARTRANENEKE